MYQALCGVLGILRESRSTHSQRETKVQNIKVIAAKVLFQMPRECQEREHLVCWQNQGQLPRRTRVFPEQTGEHSKAKEIARAKALSHEELTEQVDQGHVGRTLFTFSFCWPLNISSIRAGTYLDCDCLIHCHVLSSWHDACHMGVTQRVLSDYLVTTVKWQL